MIEYRPFQNADPPALRRLWHECELGRGAAREFDADTLESLVFSQPYFDPAGLILALDEGRTVGFAHGGFGPNPEQTGLQLSRGVVCAVMVAPTHRGQGIGRELVSRVEQYLTQRGATSIQAGPTAPLDPFYFGIYGGSQPAGFLESDGAAAPFFERLGYAPAAQRLVFQRDLSSRSTPGGLKGMNIRRTTRLAAPAQPSRHSWWWSTRPGRLDSMELVLCPKTGHQALASVTLVGLDFYLPSWQKRAIGLMDLAVNPEHRRQGYAQALLVEVCRRVRDESITLAEAHADATDEASIGCLTAAGFRQVDVGNIFQKIQA